MSTKNAIADRYVRQDDFATRVEGVEFAPEVWAVCAQLEQPRTAADLATALSLDLEAVQAALRRLLRRKLIRKHVLGWRDFAAQATPATPAVPPPVAASARAPAPTPRALAPVVSVTVTETPSRPASVHSAPPLSAPAPEAEPPLVSLFLGPTRPPAAPEKPLVQLRLAATGSSSRVAGFASAEPDSAQPTAGRWRLRPVIDAIGARAGGGLAGQLLVYRVFLQVPPDLLRAAGLHSLSLVDENFTLNHAPLRKAILDAARTHGGVDLAPLLAA